ncbi:hypothetical protein FRC07_009015 [Ceratobasidium sp. 392]|nr:hypothetical protein FRC07_009015 [Ceratobasidium sp. 392]
MLAGLRKWANVAVVASLAVLRTAVVSSPIVVQAPLEVTIHRSWDSPPASDSSDNLLFFRLASLLQHWPNSRYPHSLSVVRGTIPIGTTLYHGRPITAVPSEPEWLGFDPEISVFFLKGSSTSRITTFTTTRTLRVLYFDGTSAAKLTTGTFDTQELLVNFGEHSKNKTFDEYRRIAMLCEWGKDKDIDGYVRMEMDL